MNNESKYERAIHKIRSSDSWRAAIWASACWGCVAAITLCCAWHWVAGLVSLALMPCAWKVMDWAANANG